MNNLLPVSRVQNSKLGFTFIEVLVVVTIVAVLTAVGVVSYINTGKKTRDSRRKSDLELIRSALEMYKAESDDGTYPTSPISDQLDGYLTSGLPTDPFDSSDYYYRVNAGRTQYCLRACLEIDDELYNCDILGLSPACSSSDLNEYYVVSP